MAAHNLQNVRPRHESDEEAGLEEEIDFAEFDQEESEEEEDDGFENEEGSTSGSSEDAADEDNNGTTVEHTISSVSFGALKAAQDMISRKRKRGSDTNLDQEAKLAALRQRLQQIRADKPSATEETPKSKSAQSANHRKPARDVPGNPEGHSDSDSAPSEEGTTTKSRTSKHAPAAQSSRYQVSRKRQVIDVPKRVVRDPRFDALHHTAALSGNSEKAYSFLRDYQKSEIEELRAAMKKTKSEEDREALRRTIGSMENRIRAKEAKEREQEVIRRHRKEERERVEQGKAPYYLKRKDIKEQALVEKFKGMKSKEREKSMDKRRRKESQREKKRMPDARRMTG